MTRELDPTASLLACFGYELRRYRNDAGLSQEALGRKCNVSGSQVRMVEHAERMPDLAFAEKADKALTTGGALARLWWHVNRESHPHPVWFGPFAALEREATKLREFAPLAVPGLLQTEDYARAIFSSWPSYTTEEIEEMVTARMARQAILSSDRPPMLWTVVDEAALRRPVGGTNGGSKINMDQLDYLMEVARQPRVVVQVVTLATWEHAGLTSGFSIASFADGREVAYADSVVRGQLLDHAADVSECATLFDTLKAVALSPEASIDRISRIKEEG